MKQTFYSLLLTGISFSSLHAQDKPQTLVKGPNLVIGLQAGISRECLDVDSANLYHLYNYTHSQHRVYPSVSLFARYSVGTHIAIQAGVDYHFIKESNFTTSTYLPGTSDAALLYHNVNTTAIDVPVLLQYHLQSKDSKIRPYFGAGLTTRFLTYKMDGSYDGMGAHVPYTATEKVMQYYPTVSQGITWQLNEKWQFNESVNYMFNKNSTVLGLKLGLAYTIK